MINRIKLSRLNMDTKKGTLILGFYSLICLILSLEIISLVWQFCQNIARIWHQHCCSLASESSLEFVNDTHCSICVVLIGVVFLFAHFILVLVMLCDPWLLLSFSCLVWCPRQGEGGSLVSPPSPVDKEDACNNENMMIMITTTKMISIGINYMF